MRSPDPISAPTGSTVADVVVLGGGGAGLAAASAVAELGRRVILLEKNPQLGGSTAWSVGSVSATCTPHQVRLGIKDYPTHHHEDMKLFGGELAHRDNHGLARLIAEGAPEMFRWLLSTGLEFVGPFPEPPHRQPRMHNVLPNSRAFPFLLGRHCRRLGADLRLRTEATQLIRRGARVQGVRARMPDGSSHDFVAEHGVVLAGGDYSASPELKARYASELVAAVGAVNETATGDGIRMGVDAGGIVVNGDYVRGPILRFVPPPKKSLLFRLPPYRPFTRALRWAFEHLPQALLRPFLMSFLTTALAPERSMYRQGVILVDLDGRRFADECARPENAATHRREGKAFLVFDHTIAQRYRAWPHFISTAPAIAYAYLDDYRRTRADIFHRSSSVAGLARSMGVPIVALEKSIADYNAGVAPDGVPSRGERPRLACAPYYALGPAKAYVIFTNGGLRVSERCEVLDAQGTAIPGLFAAGSNGQSGMLLDGHGHHLGWAFVSGRIAGRSAALYEPGPIN